MSYLSLSNGAPFLLSDEKSRLDLPVRVGRFLKLFQFVKESLEANPLYQDKIIYTSKPTSLVFRFQEGKLILFCKYLILDSQYSGLGIQDEIRMNVQITFNVFSPLKAGVITQNAEHDGRELLLEIIRIVKKYEGEFVFVIGPSVETGSPVLSPRDGYNLQSLVYRAYLFEGV